MCLHIETHSCYSQEFATDMAVCMDSWVGGIRMTHFKLWLVTPDGSHCVINEMDSCVLGQLEEARDSVSLNEFIICVYKIQTTIVVCF